MSKKGGGQICRDFQRGSCRFGSRCKFVHQDSQQQFQNKAAFVSNQTANRFSALSSGNNLQSSKQLAIKEHACSNSRNCSELIKQDRKEEWPLFWRASCYAHWKYLPNDISGDLSPEELRWQTYEAVKQGQPFPFVVQQEKSLFAQKLSEYDRLLSNPYNGPANPIATPGMFPVPPQQSSTPFGAKSTQLPAGGLLFGKSILQSPTQTSPFGAPLPPIGQQFGYTPAVTPSVLATFPTSPAPFGTNQSQQSTFMGKSATQPLGFGNVPQPSTFPASASPFGVQQQPLAAATAFGTQTGVSTGFAAFHGAAPVAPTVAASLQSNLSSGGAFLTPNEPAARNMGFFSQGHNSGIQMQGSHTILGEGGDVWLADSWSLGKIPEDEPPVHAR